MENHFASSGKRILAYLIDIILLGLIVEYVVPPLLGLAIPNYATIIATYDAQYATWAQAYIEGTATLEQAPVAPAFANIASYIEIGLSLFTFIVLPLIWKDGQTLGRFLMKTKVVKLNGDNPGLDTLLLRELLGKGLVSLVTCGIAFIVSCFMVLGAKGHRTVHDRIAGTVVIDKNYAYKTTNENKKDLIEDEKLEIL